ncbi:MAG: DUF2178 domain-containing protein [Thermosediminibacteraceae bacterium]|nr:DUF2178 domain-containing protein [Thermosediminibacteraceae bacterium]
MEDEMIQAYAGKVSKKTMDIFMISLTILGLFFLGFKRIYTGLEIAGYTLLYSIFYMLLLHSFFSTTYI